MIHPDDVWSWVDFERLARTGGSIERDFRVVHPNGRIRWIRSRGEVFFDRAGKPLRAVGVVFDVTDLHETFARLDAVMERHSALTEAAFGIVWTANGNGTARDMLHWRRLTGQSIAEVSRSGWLTAIHPDDRGNVQFAWEQAVAHRTTFDCEFRLRHANGDYRWVRSRAIPMSAQNQSVYEWVGTTIDIHDQKVWPSPIDIPITGAQIRAARAIVNWSVRDLADAAHVSVSTIRRLEDFDGPPIAEETALAPIGNALREVGIEFLFPPVGKPAVRPR
jgi:PAS domain S-box-containing protein